MQILSEDNAMLDIETMAKTKNAAIISIGAVRFNSEGITDKFNININLQSSIDAGLEVDASTIKFWMEQNRDAQSVLFVNLVDLEFALKQLAHWLHPTHNIAIWGCGASFDNALLANAYQKAGIKIPWKFWNERCFRTVKNIFKNEVPTPTKREGLHEALSDAVFQAEHLIEIANFYEQD